MSRRRSSTCVPPGGDAGPVPGVPLSRDAGPVPTSQWGRVKLWYPSPIRWGCRSNSHVLVGWDANPAPVSHQVGIQVQFLCPIRLGCRFGTSVPSGWDARPVPGVPPCQDAGLARLSHKFGMQAQHPNPAGCPLGARPGTHPKIQEAPMELHQQCQVQPCIP